MDEKTSRRKSAGERFAEMISKSEPGPAAVYLVWSNRDYELGEGRSAEEATKELAELLKDGGIEITEQVADYTPGWGGWRGQHDDILEALFPLEEQATTSDGGP